MRETVPEMRSMIERAAQLVAAAENLVAFTGAGVSQESGIPTFRDPGGLWDRYDPGQVGTGDVFSELIGGRASGPAVDFVSEIVSCLEQARPNQAHVALAELEEMGILRSVITQNIDNLHREAGNTRVIEVHGNLQRLVCLKCGSKYPLDREEFLSLGRDLVRFLREGNIAGVIGLASRCFCSGLCRLDVVGFGEPVHDMLRAAQESRSCDVMLILGTSGVVWPAASLPREAKSAGARIIEVNASECCFPDLLEVGIIGRAGEVMPRILELVRQL